MLKDVLANFHLYFDEIIVERGKLCHRKGKILNVRMSEGLIKGRVKGSQSQLYDVHINLRGDDEHLSRCTCTYTINCKHAVACLFEIIARKTSSSVKKKPSHIADDNLPEEPNQDRNQLLLKQKSGYVVYYEIEFDRRGRRGIPVRLFRMKRLKNGELGKPTEMMNEDDISSRLPTSDQILALKLLGQVTLFDRRNHIRDVETLKQVVATGTAFSKSHIGKKKQKISWGKDKEVTVGWFLYQDGEFRLHIYSNQQPLSNVFLWRLPFYFDLEKNSLHLLKTSYTSEALKSLIAMKGVHVESITEHTFTHSKPTKEIPALPKIELVRKKKVPSIKVVFDAVKKKPTITDYRNDNKNLLFFVNIYYIYDGNTVSYRNNKNALYVQNNSLVEKYERNFAKEAQKFDDVKRALDLCEVQYSQAHYLSDSQNFNFFARNCPDEHYLEDLFSNLVPILESLKCVVEFKHPVFQQPIDVTDLTWFSQLHEISSGMLTYELGVIVEGETINLVPLVVDIIHNYSISDLHSLPDDHKLSLGISHTKAILIDIARIRPLINLILHFGEHKLSNGKTITLEKYQAIWLQEMELAAKAAKSRWQGAEELRNQLRKFISHDFEIDIPTGCQATLRDYQIKGVSWLQSLRICNFSGILADDMGLGKTVQTLIHLQIEKEQDRLSKPSLIVAPTSLVMNWYQEAKQFTPELKVLIYHGSGRDNDEFKHYDLVVTTYGLVQRRTNHFLQNEFYYLILDEAQFIKNARAKTTLVVQQIKADNRLCLTGTPLENHLGELWSLFHFLMPGFLGSARQFRKQFKTPIEKEYSKERQKILSKRISPFLLRRTKQEVIKDLPQKTIITRMVELSGPQRDLYEAIRLTLEKKVCQAIAERGLNKSQLIILDALLKMRQVCCDPNLLNEEQAFLAKGRSAKLELLEDILTNSIREGRRILLFSQFTSMLSIIEKRCQKLKIPYLKLTGQTRERHKLVESFQRGEVPLFIISLKAGGTGLNLTAADMVIHYDPWWNPAVEDQATDRSHRIGQVNPVFVYRLICKGTVEEAMLTLQDKKRRLISSTYEHNFSYNQMDIDTVMNFFQPISDMN